MTSSVKYTFDDSAFKTWETSDLYVLRCQEEEFKGNRKFLFSIEEKKGTWNWFKRNIFFRYQYNSSNVLKKINTIVTGLQVKFDGKSDEQIHFCHAARLLAQKLGDGECEHRIDELSKLLLPPSEKAPVHKPLVPPQPEKPTGPEEILADFQKALKDKTGPEEELRELFQQSCVVISEKNPLVDLIFSDEYDLMTRRRVLNCFLDVLDTQSAAVVRQQFQNFRDAFFRVPAARHKELRDLFSSVSLRFMQNIITHHLSLEDYFFLWGKEHLKDFFSDLRIEKSTLVQESMKILKANITRPLPCLAYTEKVFPVLSSGGQMNFLEYISECDKNIQTSPDDQKLATTHRAESAIWELVQKEFYNYKIHAFLQGKEGLTLDPKDLKKAFPTVVNVESAAERINQLPTEAVEDQRSKLLFCVQKLQPYFSETEREAYCDDIVRFLQSDVARSKTERLVLTRLKQVFLHTPLSSRDAFLQLIKEFFPEKEPPPFLMVLEAMRQWEPNIGWQGYDNIDLLFSDLDEEQQKKCLQILREIHSPDQAKNMVARLVSTIMDFLEKEKDASQFCSHLTKLKEWFEQYPGLQSSLKPYLEQEHNNFLAIASTHGLSPKDYFFLWGLENIEDFVKKVISLLQDPSMTADEKTKIFSDFLEIILNSRLFRHYDL
jgi:hypothetical protein